MRAIFTIFKKEVCRFIKDKRTLVALIMPGVLIFFLYSLMGNIVTESATPDESHKSQIAVVNLPEGMDAIFSEDFCSLSEAETKDVDTIKEKIKDGECDLLMIFPTDFSETIVSNSAIPNIEIYYSSVLTNSAAAYQTAMALLNAFESSIVDVFTVNSGNTIYDLTTSGDMTGIMFSTVLPMLLVMLLFSGCMAVAPESIAGEKERGTIATMLITPVKRRDIAIGKILALSLMALISGASSTLGVVFSLPKLLGADIKLDGSVYGISDYAMLAVVILSTVMLFITLISIISAYAKTVKEATTYVTPLMVISMLIGLSGMMGSSVDNPALYFIPIFNSVQSMVAVFSFESNLINVLITVGTNLVVTGVGIFALTKMFESEKIMFNK